jgi:hypothetical protein
MQHECAILAKTAGRATCHRRRMTVEWTHGKNLNHTNELRHSPRLLVARHSLSKCRKQSPTTRDKLPQRGNKFLQLRKKFAPGRGRAGWRNIQNTALLTAMSAKNMLQNRSLQVASDKLTQA